MKVFSLKVFSKSSHPAFEMSVLNQVMKLVSWGISLGSVQSFTHLHWLILSQDKLMSRFPIKLAETDWMPEMTARESDLLCVEHLWLPRGHTLISLFYLLIWPFHMLTCGMHDKSDMAYWRVLARWSCGCLKDEEWRLWHFVTNRCVLGR